MMKTIYNKDQRVDKNLLLNFLAADSIILEAGAHIGSDTAELSKLFSKGIIYAFEPVPELFTRLQQNVGHATNVVLFNLALDAETSQKKMYISSGASDGSSSLLQPQEVLRLHPTVFWNSCASVNTITVNDWAEQRRIERLDFMWLDLEGNELNVLTKSEKVLPQVKAIFTEVSFCERYRGGCLFHELQAFLAGFGFKAIMQDPDELANILFIRDSS